MDMLKYQEQLAEEFHYKPLPPIFSQIERNKFLADLPEEFKNYKKGSPVYSKSGLKICDKLSDRIFVCGDYGLFLEAEPEDILPESLRVEPGQEFRLDRERYGNTKYIWYNAAEGLSVKIYFQQHEVTYADYKIGKYYFSPYEVSTKK